MGYRVDGYWSGYDAYRRGDTKRGIQRKHAAIFTGEERKQVVAETRRLLMLGNSTMFEYEGACRQGIRSALCLKGHGWQAADSEAANLISEAFKRMGAARPSWEQGQREYVVPRESCSWCEKPVPEDFLSSNHTVMFCSSVCANTAKVQREYVRHRREGRMLEAVYNVVYREKQEARDCVHCGTRFRPLFEGGRYCSKLCADTASVKLEDRVCPVCEEVFHPRNYASKYCSRECNHVGRSIVPEADCLHCKKKFHPRTLSREAKFCSPRCRYAHGSTLEYPGRCLYCDKEFLAKSPKAKACSQTCAQRISNLKSGKWTPALNPYVFDFVITKPVNAAPRRLTPAVFDALCEAA